MNQGINNDIQRGAFLSNHPWTKTILLAVGIATFGLLLARGAGAEQPDHPPTELLHPFSYADVSLTGGPLGEQAQVAREFYLNLSEDNLLNGFRKRAGLPAPGQPMGGWYDPENFAGAHPFGQFVSALARFYAETGDARFKQKVARLVHGFHETIAPDGFFYSSLKVATNWPCYLYDKNCTGMRDAYTLAGNEEALVVLKKMTDWAFEHLPRRRDEWYTLPENLYNCYELTKDERYLQMAREFDYSKEYYDPFATGLNAFTQQRHAYSHVNSLCSAARAYEATGDKKYFNTVSNAWQFLTTTEMFASGGWGPNERFVTPGQGKLAAALSQTNSHFRKNNADFYAKDFETPCGCYANANLDRYLLRFTGNAKYGDNLERLLMNGVLAALPMQPDGRTFYYSDYHAGARKQYFPSLWPCCSGTYAEITADYPLDIYFHDDQALYVNLFTPSKVRWSRGGNMITVEQSGDFPRSDSVVFTIHTKKPTRFPLKLRVPAWATMPGTWRVNGKTVSAKSPPNTFLTINRRWHDGDTLTATFPVPLRFEPVDAQTPHLAALMYGPLMLVALANDEVHLHGDQSRPADWIHLQSKNSMTFQTQNGNVLFRPFYLITNEHYTTYCDVSATAKQDHEKQN